MTLHVAGCVVNRERLPRPGEARNAPPGDDSPVRSRQPFAGVLALASIALAAAGMVLALAHAGGALGVLLVAAAAPVAVLAWLALGAPVRRRDLAA